MAAPSYQAFLPCLLYDRNIANNATTIVRVHAKAAH
jgi:hypothetical protein